MGRLPQPRPSRPRDRLRDFLASRYNGRPSDLASELKCSKKSAENLLDGHWPADDLKLAAIFCRFGRDLYDAVFAPDVNAVVARLQEEERQLAEQLAEIRNRRRQAEGLVQRGPGISEAADDQTGDLFGGDI
jgi:hypothetical protein